MQRLKSIGIIIAAVSSDGRFMFTINSGKNNSSNYLDDRADVF
jgi:hypothetical protein